MIPRVARAASMGAALGLVLASTAAAQVSGERNPGVLIDRIQPLVVESDLYTPPADDDQLERADEIAFARALSLVQTQRVDEGLDELRRLVSRYPGSRRLASATASAFTLAGRPGEALRVLDQAARHLKSAKNAASGRSREPLFARERAEALLVLGRRQDAIPFMAAAAVDGNPSSSRLRSELLEWAETTELGPRVADALGRQSDAAPKQIDLALLAAEVEVRAARPERGWARLRRTEAKLGQGRSGELLRVLAERLSSDARAGLALGTSSWLELARGPYDGGLRAEGLARVLGHDLGPADLDVPAESAAVRARELEAAWRALPPGDARARTGLQLVEYLRLRGLADAARRVSASLGQSAAPAELAGQVGLEAGLSAIQRGDLAEAQRRLVSARASASDPEARERSAYALAETWFYLGQLDSALAGFDAFAQANPQSPLANDALERAYLLEGDSPNGGADRGRAGLDALARGLYAEARGQWEEAARLAHQADDQARSAFHAPPPPVIADRTASPESDPLSGPRDPVRAHALLLLSRAEEKRGGFDLALAAAILVADSLSGDRLAPLARKRAGDLLYARGRHDEALGQYEEMLARYPRSWAASEVRRRVTELRARRTP